MLAFHAPPDAVTIPVTKYGKIPGKIKCRQRSMELKRKTFAASFKSVGIAIAPAITLNRMYHCVPSSIKAIAAISTPPDEEQQQHREQRRCWNRSCQLHQWLHEPRKSRTESDRHPHWYRPQRPNQQRPVHTQKRQARAAEQFQIFSHAKLRQFSDRAINPITKPHCPNRRKDPRKPPPRP